MIVKIIINKLWKYNESITFLEHFCAVITTIIIVITAVRLQLQSNYSF